jgi:glycosyltransferase involved in cell wall biosynthesis
MRNFLAPPPERPVLPAPAPSVSIIIPAYQAASFVADAVESALGQTVAPHEVIVCDDGSTDDLAGALAAFSGRITLLRKEHGGTASARNVAIRSATSDFVAFLDADNVFLPDYLEAVAELAAVRPDLDILTTDAYLELDGEVYGRYYRGKARFIVDDQRRGIIHQHFVFGNCTMRRKALLAVGGYDETVLAEDTDLFVRMILGGSRAGLIDEPLCVYRIRGGSLSSSRPRSLRAAVVVIERASSHSSLTPDELRYLQRQLAGARREAELAEAEEALRGFAPHPRRLALRIAFGPRSRLALQTHGR